MKDILEEKIIRALKEERLKKISHLNEPEEDQDVDLSQDDKEKRFRWF